MHVHIGIHIGKYVCIYLPDNLSLPLRSESRLLSDTSDTDTSDTDSVTLIIIVNQTVIKILRIRFNQN